MYKSPIDIIYKQAEMQMENDIFRAVQSYGINVDKEELIRALRYDRQQYEKGYMDGKAAAAAEIVRCKDCKHMYCCSAIDRMFYCRHPKGLKGMPNIVEENPFCPYGERKEDE